LKDRATADRELSAGLKQTRLLAALCFAAMLAVSLLLVGIDRENHLKTRQANATMLASTQANLIHQRLDAALSATYALAVVLRQHDYHASYDWFEPYARELLRYHPGISSLQYGPKGITTFVVPLAGNERAVGNNLLLNTKRNKEALQAIATRKLTLAGPFELVQGGVGLAGRLPIFTPATDKDDGFWGFAVSLIRVEELLRSADVERLARAGYDYTLWRVHPDTGAPHVFAKSGPDVLPDGVTLSFEVPNGTWSLTLLPRGGWMAEAGWEYTFKYVLASLLAVFAGGVIFVILRQPVLLRHEVETRTHELRAANELLARENREREAAQAELKLADKVIESSAESIMITDERSRIVRVNDAFCRTTGYSPEEVLGRDPSLLNSGRHDEAFFEGMYSTLRVDGHWQGEIWNRRRSGEIFPQWLGITVLKDAEGKPAHFVSIGTDISERKASEERIHYLAHYDALTGLPNRLLLRDRVQQAIVQATRSGEKVALLSLDLDRFKIVNDTLGHQTGDELLRQVVGRLKLAVRSSDTVSRQGGDEFVIVSLGHSGPQTAGRIAAKINDRLAEPFFCAGREVRVSSSIGIAMYPDDGTDFETLIKKCDIAMYHAKESGRATHRFFTDALNANSHDRLQLEADLRRAVEKQEFVLHYQPQIDLETRRVVGAEALVRWNDPARGMVPPGLFIPLAEEIGLIVPMDHWVMAEACRQARAWEDAGLPAITISVNLSALVFRQPDLIERVGATLATSGLAPERLELELTESVLVDDVEKMIETVRRLKALGVKLAIDDFGTGYSSLAYLKRFAVDKLKIDQSFVRGDDPQDAAIVQAVIQLGQSLQLKTIAEGAETEAQVQRLRSKGCYEVQGYYFSRPLPADEFVAFLRRAADGVPADRGF
jgi:diguanylate cyclase (GGDEF)-like protein/PAS domain S-box-containing protein